jgi:hypothetical protein
MMEKNAVEKPLEAEVGRLAGEIWRYLREHRSASALELKAAVKTTNSYLFLALGWLGREGKIELIHTNDTFTVSFHEE